jgi:methionyl-tRNA formyltransferase
MGAGLLLKTIKMMQHGAIRQIPQDDSSATYAPRLKKEDGCIRWDSDVNSIVNLIRGLSPGPCAYTFFNGKKIKIYSSTWERTPITGSAGKIGRETEKGLPVTAKNGFVYIEDVQLEGKKRMPVHDFLKGFRMMAGDSLG